MRSARAFWLFGLSGAGKSVLGDELAKILREEGKPVLRLDGDQFRAGLCRDLGFDRVSRIENIRRAAHIAQLATQQGLIVIASFITPLQDMRYYVQQTIGVDRTELIWVDAPLSVCQKRDTKGLYLKNSEGRLHHMTGVDSLFEEPKVSIDMDCHIETSDKSIDQSVEQISLYAEIKLQQITR